MNEREASAISESNSLQGQRILVASGPTRAPIDAVRYIGNRSTGRLGSAIGTELLRRGATVTFIYGTGSRTPDPTLPNLILDEIETIDQAESHILGCLQNEEIRAAVMAMACLDYRPKEVAAEKISSEPEERTITLVKCPKIIDRIKEISPSVFLVGFKLQAGVSEESLFVEAEKLAERAHCDLVVANRTEDIAGDRHRAWFISVGPSGRVVEGPYETPDAIAGALADRLVYALECGTGQ
ncbi:MAG TPA: phosphopantothenoylcysteine decarboxylase [bacterium]|nr:phosphopantothenoylcysteine decarboxylase [bacterium]